MEQFWGYTVHLNAERPTHCQQVTGVRSPGGHGHIVVGTGGGSQQADQEVQSLRPSDLFHAR